MPFKLHVVLFEPEIAGNVGSIMRTCVATNAKLHLIQPFGFFLDDRFIKRSSVNYFQWLDYQVYDDLADFEQQHPAINIYYTTGHTSQLYSDINFSPMEEVYVMFGRESTGIKPRLLTSNPYRCIRLPMTPHMRSLNVANTVTTVVYEILKQKKFLNLL